MIASSVARVTTEVMALFMFSFIQMVVRALVFQHFLKKLDIISGKTSRSPWFHYTNRSNEYIIQLNFDRSLIDSYLPYKILPYGKK